LDNLKQIKHLWLKVYKIYSQPVSTQNYWFL